MRLLEQFKHAVRYGSGKAYWILKKHPDLPVDDFLVESALKNYDLDPQSSGNRAIYMDELLELRPDYRKLLERIARKFDKDETLSEWDADQGYELLCGNSSPSKDMIRIVHERFLRKFFKESDFGFCAITDHEGASGVLFVARAMGRKLQDDPAYWLSDWIPAHWDGAGYDFNWRTLLERHRKEPEIAAFLDAIRKETEDKSKRTPVPVRNMAWLENLLKNGMYQPFTRLVLTESDGAVLRKRLLEETDQERQKILCRALTFNGMLTVDLFEPLIKLLDSPDEPLRDLALSALAKLSDHRIPGIARDELRRNPDAWEYMELLVPWWERKDEDFVRPIFRKFHSADIRHSVIMMIMDAPDTSPDLLLFLYRHCLCGFCRTQLIEAMVQKKSIPRSFVQELLHESQLDIRKVAKQLEDKS